MESTKTPTLFPEASPIKQLLTWALVLLAVCATTAVPSTAQEDEEIAKLWVLFVGNSQTFRNQVYSIVERMSYAASMEMPVGAERLTRGGETFARHTESTDPDAPLKVLARGGWHYVVLQEHGRIAAESGGTSLPYASRLVKAARDADTIPLFYMTWAYRDNPEAQAQISRTYFQLGSKLNVQVAPAGEAFQLARKTAPDIELYASDGIHASLEGSYLAACVIFSKLYSRSPVGIPLKVPGSDEKVADIDPEHARRLQNIAWRTLKSYKQPNGN